MYDADMILVQTEGLMAKAFDLYSINHNTPQRDQVQNIEYYFRTDGKRVTVYVERRLSTGDES